MAQGKAKLEAVLLTTLILTLWLPLVLPQQATAKTETVLRVGYWCLDIDCMIEKKNLYVCVWSRIAVMGWIVESLARLRLDAYLETGDPSKLLQPWLAEKWEWVREGEKWVLVVHLRKGVTWNDGTPFTAKDVWTHYMLLKALGYSNLDVLERVKVIDDYTVKLYVKDRSPDVEYTLLYEYGWMAAPYKEYGKIAEQAPTSPKRAAQALRKHVSRRLWGTGPYKFAGTRSMKIATTRHLSYIFSVVVLAKRSEYWDRPLLSKLVDRVELIRLGRLEPREAAMMVERGDIDVAVMSPLSPSNWLPSFTPLEHVEIINYTEWWGILLLFNYIKNPWLRDYRVRKALAYVIGVDATLKKLNEELLLEERPEHHYYYLAEYPTGLAVVPRELVLKRNLERYSGSTRDLEKAARLLEEAGFRKKGGKWYTPDGKEFKIVITGYYYSLTHRVLADVITSRLQSFGIEAEARTTTDWYRTVAVHPHEQNWDVAVQLWNTLPPHPWGTLSSALWLLTECWTRNVKDWARIKEKLLTYEVEGVGRVNLEELLNKMKEASSVDEMMKYTELAAYVVNKYLPVLPLAPMRRTPPVLVVSTVRFEWPNPSHPAWSTTYPHVRLGEVLRSMFREGLVKPKSAAYSPAPATVAVPTTTARVPRTTTTSATATSAIAFTGIMKTITYTRTITLPTAKPITETAPRTRTTTSPLAVRPTAVPGAPVGTPLAAPSLPSPSTPLPLPVAAIAGGCAAVAAAVALRARAGGTLVVESSVEGAEVYVNGNPVGRVPVRVRVRPGRHEVRVVAEGFEEYGSEVVVEKGETKSVFAALVPAIRGRLVGLRLQPTAVHAGEELVVELEAVNETRTPFSAVAALRIGREEFSASLGEVSLGTIGPEASKKVSARVRVPSALAPGPYDLEVSLRGVVKGASKSLDSKMLAKTVYVLRDPGSVVPEVLGRPLGVPRTPKKVKWLEKEVELAGYRLVGFLGEGAFSCTFLALEREGGSCVVKVPKELCMTVLLGESASSEETVVIPRAFLRELEVLKRVSEKQHPHVVKFYGALDVVPAIVLEYCEGGSLADALSKGYKLSVRDAVILGIQVADALLAAYEAGLQAHRDLKPSNILFTRDGVARLTDFNISRIMGSVSRGMSIAGTPGYMAPEQLKGEASERSDVFSLTLVLIEALTGRNPLGEAVGSLTGYGDYVEAVRRASTAALEALRRLEAPPRALSELEKLVAEALEPEPERRPSMKALRDRLADVLQLLEMK